jgi:[ribosomal protein S5]-alanine N-acetyltransferase
LDKILLHTKRLKVRNLKESDLDEFYAYRSNPEITRYQGFNTFSREESLNFIQEHSKKMLILPGEWIQFAIEDNYHQKLVGDCAIYLHQADSRIAEIGITISHLHQRQGYARETMLGLMDFLFMSKGIHRIVETVDAENIASIQMLKGLSFRQEAHFRENIFFKGKWGSEYLFAMLSWEWDDLQLNLP